ncbi:DNA adenine methylase [Xenorhabdus mauleonii]|uniref:DNA adenine methylase n=1 Tax=Xenorhabdus mauleonii TaxID=351675 RepID=A0A1I3N6Z4_9GAMM|nr:DNA adenine methylase [Xenorhabdus mauleonii]SFJ04949.1 site-specific DNA-methyltransferase (adenine-specific) [Xenorhabdus mauleonii]
MWWQISLWGLGVTLKVALKLNRRVLGVELEEERFN